jgi:hypothetical protein
MLKDEIEKKIIKLKKDKKKYLSQSKLIYKTNNSGHEIGITSWKANKNIYYEA